VKRELTEEQKAATAERRAKFGELVRQVTAMTDEQRQQLAARIMVTTVEQHTLSMHNQILVALQAPSATIVGGFQQWRAQGRKVSKGQHGIAIWIPKKEKKDDTGEEGEIKTFFMGYVFDITQTEVAV